MEILKILKSKLPNGFVYGAIIAGFCLIGLFIAIGKDIFGVLNLIATMVVVGLLLMKTNKDVDRQVEKFSKPIKKCLECGSTRRHKKTCSKFKPIGVK